MPPVIPSLSSIHKEGTVNNKNIEYKKSRMYRAEVENLNKLRDPS
jgi:hypothetical protein